MKKSMILLLLLALSLITLHAQDEWKDETPKKKGRNGWLVMGTASYDIPLADMADRFGNSYTFGGGVMHKSTSNFFYQAFAEFIFGNKVRQNEMYLNVGYNNLQLYDLNGNLRNITLGELGMNLGIGAGKTFLLNKTKSLDNGINIMTSLSLLQHRINHEDLDGVLPQAIGDYAKGYDYLTNGLCINQSVNYIHFSRRTFANYSVGLNFRLGLTKNRRSIDYYTGMHDDQLRSDFMVGFLFRWLIPLYKKYDTEVYF